MRTSTADSKVAVLVTDGSNNAGQLDPATAARATGGTSFRARDAEALEDVFSEIDRMETTVFTSTRLVRYREEFEPWAFAALGLLLAGTLLEGVAGRLPW